MGFSYSWIEIDRWFVRIERESKEINIRLEGIWSFMVIFDTPQQELKIRNVNGNLV